MTNIELIYMLTAFPLSVEQHNKLRELIKEYNLDYLVNCNKNHFKDQLDQLFEGCYELNKGDKYNEKI